MRVFGPRFWIATLLAAVVVVPGSLVAGHSHSAGHTGSPGHAGSPGHLGDHSGAPVYSGGHAEPDPSLHVEAASILEVPECAACSLLPRERAAERVKTSHDRLETGSRSALPASDSKSASGYGFSQGARGPPRH